MATPQPNNHLAGLFSFTESYTSTALDDLSGEKVGRLIRKFGMVADRELMAIRERARTSGVFEGTEPACKMGCDLCCRQAVRASIPEVLCVAVWLRNNKSAEELAAIKKAASAYRAKYEQADEPTRTACRDACPMLVNSSCSVYEARPLVCRTFHSYDFSACERLFAGDNEAVLLGKHMHPASVTVVDTMRHGIRAGMESKNHSAPLANLGIAISIALENEDAAGRWLAGEELFAPAMPIVSDQ